MCERGPGRQPTLNGPSLHTVYATEAAREALRHGFEQVGLAEVVSMTAVRNVRSQAVMNKLGMTHQPGDDFDHPRVPDGHPVQRHVLYRLTAERWRSLAR